MRLALLLTVFCVLSFYSRTGLADGTECRAQHNRRADIDFSGESCRQVAMQNYTMGHQVVWLRVPAQRLLSPSDNDEHLSLYLSGNFVADVYLNDEYLGSKGIPSISPSGESTGPFDWSVYAGKRPQYKPEDSLVLFMSSHKNLLAEPVQFNRLYIGPLGDTTTLYGLTYAVSLIPFGTMLIVFLYLLYRRHSAVGEPVSGCLFVLLGVAMVQLLIEVSRGYVAYPYPVHIVRLYAIAFCAFVFGQWLLWFSLNGISLVWRARWLSISAALTLGGQYAAQDFDYKAIFAFQAPALIGWLIACYCWRNTEGKEKARNRLFASIFMALLVTTLLTRNAFLDAYFYWFIAAVLMALVVAEINHQKKVYASLSEAREEARKLEFALTLNGGNSDNCLILKSSGNMSKIPISDILCCKGAGDYVELILNKKTLLYSGSLQSLQTELPGEFLKVHRSYLVNGRYIQSISRKSSGNGEILLTNGLTVPVSRTLFAQVRQAIFSS